MEGTSSRDFCFGIVNLSTSQEEGRDDTDCLKVSEAEASEPRKCGAGEMQNAGNLKI